MAREPAKRSVPRRTGKGGAAAKASARPARAKKPEPQLALAKEPPGFAAADAPTSSALARAPGRGKYDRSRSADERQKEQLRRLLEAAGQVFSEMGWADATVEAIVSRAGMSRRTFYEHFDDLSDCLMTLVQRVTRVAFRAVETQVKSQVETPDMLRVGVTAFLGGIAMFPHMARVLFRVVRAAGPEFEAVHEQMMGRFEKLVFDGVQYAYDIGRVKRPPDEIRVFALVSAMEAVAMRFVTRGEEAKALEAAPVLVEMVQKVFN